MVEKIGVIGSVVVVDSAPRIGSPQSIHSLKRVRFGSFLDFPPPFGLAGISSPLPLLPPLSLSPSRRVLPRDLRVLDEMVHENVGVDAVRVGTDIQHGLRVLAGHRHIVRVLQLMRVVAPRVVGAARGELHQHIERPETVHFGGEKLLELLQLVVLRPVVLVHDLQRHDHERNALLLLRRQQHLVHHARTLRQPRVLPQIPHIPHGDEPNDLPELPFELVVDLLSLRFSPKTHVLAVQLPIRSDVPPNRQSAEKSRDHNRRRLRRLNAEQLPRGNHEVLALEQLHFLNDRQRRDDWKRTLRGLQTHFPANAREIHAHVTFVHVDRRVADPMNETPVVDPAGRHENDAVGRLEVIFPANPHDHRHRGPVFELFFLFEFDEHACPVHVFDEIPVGVVPDGVHGSAVENHAERPLVESQQRVAGLQRAFEPRPLDLRLIPLALSHHLHRSLVKLAQLLHEVTQTQRLQRVAAPLHRPVHAKRLLQALSLQLREGQRLCGELEDRSGLGGEKAVVGGREVLVALHDLADVGGNAALELGLLGRIEGGAVGGVEGEGREGGRRHRGHDGGGNGVEGERGGRHVVENHGVALGARAEIQHGALEGREHRRMQHALAESRGWVRFGSGGEGRRSEGASRLGGFRENSARIVEKRRVQSEWHGSRVVR